MDEQEAASPVSFRLKNRRRLWPGVDASSFASHGSARHSWFSFGPARTSGGVLGRGRCQLDLDRRRQLQMTQRRGQDLCRKGSELWILTRTAFPFEELSRHLIPLANPHPEPLTTAYPRSRRPAA